MKVVEKKLPEAFGKTILYPESADLYNFRGQLLAGHMAGFFDLLNQMQFQPDVFIDVGANYGLVSIMADKILSPNRIDAFECNPDVFETMKQNLDMLNTDSISHNLAAGNHDDKIKYSMIPADKDNAFGSLDMFGYVGEEKTETIDLERVKLDSLYSDEKNKISMIKIDVEGFEADVLKGAAGVIQSHRPIIVYEILELAAHQHTHEQLWRESKDHKNMLWRKTLAGHSHVLNADEATKILIGMNYEIAYFPWSKCDVLAIPKESIR